MYNFFQKHRSTIAYIFIALFLVACAVTEVKVDVYKGPLSNTEEVRTQQAISLVVAAEPMLKNLRDSLEQNYYDWFYCKSDYEESMETKWKDYRVAKQEDLKDILQDYDFQDDLARNVHSILTLYEDQSSSKLSKSLKQLQEELQTARYYYNNFKSYYGNEEKIKSFDDDDATPIQKSLNRFLGSQWDNETFFKEFKKLELPDESYPQSVISNIDSENFVHTLSFTEGLSLFENEDFREGLKKKLMVDKNEEVIENASLEREVKSKLLMMAEASRNFKKSRFAMQRALDECLNAYAQLSLEGQLEEDLRGDIKSTLDTILSKLVRRDFQTDENPLFKKDSKSPSEKNQFCLEDIESFLRSQDEFKADKSAPNPYFKGSGTSNVEKWKYRRKYGFSSGPRDKVIKSLEQELSKINLVRRELKSLSLIRGRLENGVFTEIEKYLNSDDYPKANDKIWVALMNFGEKLSSLANLEAFVQDDKKRWFDGAIELIGVNPNSKERQRIIQRYKAVLQTIGNSITSQAEEYFIGKDYRASASAVFDFEEKGLEGSAKIYPLTDEGKKVAAIKFQRDTWTNDLKKVDEELEEIKKKNESVHTILAKEHWEPINLKDKDHKRKILESYKYIEENPETFRDALVGGISKDSIKGILKDNEVKQSSLLELIRVAIPSGQEQVKYFYNHYQKDDSVYVLKLESLVAIKVIVGIGEILAKSDADYSDKIKTDELLKQWNSQFKSRTFNLKEVKLGRGRLVLGKETQKFKTEETNLIANTVVELIEKHKLKIDEIKAEVKNSLESFQSLVQKKDDLESKLAGIKDVVESKYELHPTKAESIGDRYSHTRVIDQVITTLKYEKLNAERTGNLTLKNNIDKALASAYMHRSGLMQLKPAMTYLRNSFTATSLSKSKTSRNILNNSLSYLIPQGWTPSGRDRRFERKVLDEIDAQYWQNVNSVKVRRSGGKGNSVIAKDDIGNWYVKSYSNDPTELHKSMRNLALYSQGLALPQISVEKTFVQAYDNPLERVLKKYQELYLLELKVVAEMDGIKGQLKGQEGKTLSLEDVTEVNILENALTNFFDNEDNDDVVKNKNLEGAVKKYVKAAEAHFGRLNTLDQIKTESEVSSETKN